MKCPRDQTELVPRNGSITVLICETCQGLFVKNPELRDHVEKILKKSPIHTQAAEYLESPFDGKAMTPVKIKGVTIDLCPRSGYIWLDHGEYLKVQEALKLDNTQTTGIGTDVALEVANVTVSDPDILSAAVESIWDTFEKVFDGITNI